MIDTNIEEILKRSRVGGLTNVYILGNKAKRVTFHAQQRRAYNLIWALIEAGNLKKSNKVAIVGGGLAGMTAALAANNKGGKVTIYEQAQTLLSLWSTNRHRFVHPNIYDWPKPGSNIELTQLPALNWRADFAHKVAHQVMAEWEIFKGSIKVETRTIVSMLSEGSGKIKLSTNPYDLVEFDCVILAVGFGIEKTYNIVNASTYWDGDKIDSIAGSTLVPKKKILITGCGDGGMIDVLRKALANFDHQDFSQEFLNHAEFEAIKQTIIDAEEEFTTTPSGAVSEKIFNIYKSLASEGLEALLRPQLRDNTEIWLNSDTITPLTGQSSVHNRVLVSLLIKLRVINFLSGRATNYDQQEDGSYIVTVARADGRIVTKHFDEVIIRHGPKELLTELLGPTRTIPPNDEPDPTSQKLWPDSFYSGFPSPTPNQRKFMTDHFSSLYDRIGNIDYEEAVGITLVAQKPHYRINFLPTAPEGHLEHLKEHKGYPIFLERKRSDILPQSGEFISWYKYREPVLAIGAPIANKMNHSYGKQSFGTLGCFVVNSHGQLGCISTSHVLKSAHYLNVNDVDILYDPNSFRFMKSERVGRLTNIVPLKLQPTEQIRYHFNDRENFNQIDAGMVIIESHLTKPIFKKEMGIVRSDAITLGQSVKKLGAGSGITFGEVSAISCRIKVQFDEGVAVFNDVFEVKGISKTFSTAGDSGALVMSNDNRAMGIIFAGNSDVSYVCPIEPILSFLRCRIVKIEDSQTDTKRRK